MPLRAVIYARFSSDKQRAESIADQIEVDRRYIETMGLQLVGTYDDPAISGASVFTRPGYQRMMRDAAAGAFDVIVVEAIDRLGRNLADVARCYDQLIFHRVQLHAVSLGLVTQMHIALLGMMAQMQITDLAAKTKRGQLGRVRAGKSASGIAYGYDAVPPPPGCEDRGERRINPEQAAVVRRIFRDYDAGKAPRTIAAELNREGVPSPRGKPWADTTIRGQGDRGTGILNNVSYIGQLAWNRCSYVKNPNTGKRIARPNRTDQYEVTEASELRIIDDPLWQRVKARQAAVRTTMGKDENGNALNRAHRQKYLLSGLLHCTYCGEPFAIIGKDRFGCRNFRSKGTCTNSRTIRRQRIEGRVTEALKHKMLTPELTAQFVRTFEEEIARLQRENVSSDTRIQSLLQAAERKLSRIKKELEDDLDKDTEGSAEENEATKYLKQRMNEVSAEKRQLQEQLAAAEPVPQVNLPPDAASLYAAKVANLEEALNDEAIRSEAAEILSRLISKVLLTPDNDAADGLRAELHGDLAEILSLTILPDDGDISGVSAKKNSRARLASESLLSVVAGARFELTTFRL